MSTKKHNPRNNDPHAGREAAQYEAPLPSRELVLQMLADQGVPLPVEQVYALLEIKEEERDNFNKRLNAMEREGQIMRNRKGALCLADKIHAIAGTVQGHPDGFGFLVPDDKIKHPDDLFLGPREMAQVMHGDRAMVRMSGLDRKGRPEGKIVEVLERSTKTLVGRVIQGQGVTIVAAEDKRINQDILIPYHLDMGAKPGQVVMVELTAQPSSGAHPMGKVVQILGNYADSGMEIEIALRKHKLPHEFSGAAIKQAESIPKLVQAADYKGRIDLRELPLITIDGETARDFDDAVYAEPIYENQPSPQLQSKLPLPQAGEGWGEGNNKGIGGIKGWRLVVAIADVSFYVKPDDALDKEAFERGNSVYFPRRVIPMLPEALSNGLCSLNPDVERLCMICDMQIDALGIVNSYKFYPSVMRSKARMTYTKVAEMLENPQGETAKEYAHIMPHVQNLYALFKLMLTQREKRGAIEFESTETQMIFDDNGKIDKIIPVQRNDAHKLIEECMLAANVCAADFLSKNEQAALYRIHEGPTPEKLEALRTFMAEVGFGVTGGDKPHAKDYGKLMNQIKTRPDAQLLQTVLLRSMQQAVYSPDNVGHFGLAYEAYAHFTSPIRRYPDLLIHRAIKAVVNGEKYKAKDWNNLGVHCSMTERRADEATRDVNNWLKCYYMQDKIGEVYEGTIAGVTAFGVFVALDGVYVEGLVHVTELGNDYFNYDKARHEMLGERTGVRFRLGDRLTIKVARVDLETSKIDFTLVSHSSHLKTNNTTPSMPSSTRAASRADGKNTLNANKDKVSTDFKPLTSRALDRAKKDRTGGKKLGKSASKSSIHSSPKSRDRNTKNKGKR